MFSVASNSANGAIVLSGEASGLMDFGSERR